MAYYTCLTGLPGRLLAFLVLALVSNFAHAQTPSWQTAITIPTSGTNSSTVVNATAPDASGNVYVAGSFQGIATFGNTVLTSTGTTGDLFVAKWNSTSASFTWARRVGGDGNDVASGLAVSGSNVYVTGIFTSSTLELDGTLLTNAAPGGPDGFVACLTDGGTAAAFKWAQRISGVFSDYATAVAVSGSSVYVAGGATGPATFGTIIFNGFGVNSAFVAKLTDRGTSGTFDWVLGPSGPTASLARALAVRGSGIYVAGEYDATITVGATTLVSAGSNDLFVAKITDAGTSGSFTWAQGVSGSGDEEVRALAVQGSNVYIAGTFSSPVATFGGLTVPTRSPGDYAVFVAKLTDAGSNSAFAWAYSAGGPGNDLASAMAVAGSAVYVAGQYSLSATFGSLALVGARANDVFVTRLTDAGPLASFDWVQTAGGLATDEARTLTVAGSRLYVGGVVTSSATFGPFSLTGAVNVPTGFLASLTDPLPTATAKITSAMALSVYPNPARELVTVPTASAITELILVDAVGRVVRQGRGAVLDVRGIVPGLYVVRAAEPGKPSRAARVVVE